MGRCATPVTSAALRVGRETSAAAGPATSARRFRAIPWWSKRRLRLFDQAAVRPRGAGREFELGQGAAAASGGMPALHRREQTHSSGECHFEPKAAGKGRRHAPERRSSSFRLELISATYNPWRVVIRAFALSEFRAARSRPCVCRTGAPYSQDGYGPDAAWTAA